MNWITFNDPIFSVIVQSLPNKPSLDLDTVLFLDNGTKVLGQIFDVFGQVCLENIIISLSIQLNYSNFLFFL